MQITRHYLTLLRPDTGGLGAVRDTDSAADSEVKGGRRVHYRKCGSGPPLVMVHQSPRSSAEYEALMQQWGGHFTCIAPDTPGFGQSEPLAHPQPEIAEYADALAEFVHALGIAPCAAYGFHSGGIILVTAVKRQPDLLTGLAVGGYAIWSQAEMDLFGTDYLPAFHSSGYGEHLTWLWNRILEQSWFFPWFDVRDKARLSVAHADPDRVHAVVMEMLDAGKHYQAGYGAVLRAPRDIPAVDADVPPCLITAYNGDPLQEHIDRLGAMPPGWNARKVTGTVEHQAQSLAFLQAHAGAPVASLPQHDDAGWLSIGDGLIHWRGARGARKLVLHAPGAELAEPAESEIAIDLPGHGLSSNFANIEHIIHQCMADLGATDLALPDLPTGDPELLYPDLTPDRFGTHLAKAWSIARAQVLFDPWYAADADHVLPVDADRLTSAAIALRARALLRAGPAARLWHDTLTEMHEEISQ